MRKWIQLGMFLAVTLLLSYVESLFPLAIGLPGFKLGLPNLGIVLCLYLYGSKEALCVNIARILISGFLFGNLYGILYGLAGGMCSFFAMVLLKRMKKSDIRMVSAFGGLFHNIGQLFMAYFVVRTTAIWYYLPILCVVGMATGLINGTLAKIVQRNLNIKQL